MAFFRLDVANRETGKEASIVISANDAADAERIAQQRGLLVSRVHPYEHPVPQASDEAEPTRPQPAVLSPEPARANGSGASIWIACSLLAIAVSVLVVGRASDLEDERDWHLNESLRRQLSAGFKSDNAYGATANAAGELVAIGHTITAQNDALIGNVYRFQIILICCTAAIAVRLKRT